MFHEAEIARLSIKAGILTTESENYVFPKGYMVSHGRDILADTEYFKNWIRSDNGVFEMIGSHRSNVKLARNGFTGGSIRFPPREGENMS